MRKLMSCGLMVLILFMLFTLGTAAADRVFLRNRVIRLHILANSDSNEDQRVKLEVKKAVTDRLGDMLRECENVQEALLIITDNIGELEDVANQTLDDCASACMATVFLTEESFDRSEYENFSLPSGVYQSLQVRIGDAIGQNWWCVVFPSLCEPVVAGDFEAVAVNAGFSDSLSATIAGNEKYKIRFWIIDFLGKIESIFNNSGK